MPTEPPEQRDAYELALGAAIPLLPPPVRGAIEAAGSAFRDAYLPDARHSDQDDQAAAGRHSVCLDVGAETNDPAGRRMAAAAFPKRQSDARKLYEAHGRGECGSLPWAIEEEFGRLVEAFKSGEGPRVAAQTGTLMHFAVDAALPFNTTTLAHPRANAPASSEDETGSQAVAEPPMRLAERFHGALVQRLRERLAFETAVWPERVSPASDPLAASLHTMLEAREAAEVLLVMDAELVDELGPSVAAAVASADVYLARLAEKAAPVLESQIEAGALLAANLVHGAWIEAGRPGLTATATPSVAGSDVARPAAAPAAQSAFVGSLDSSVYHRASCTHCARIKPENTVRFATAQEAEAAGRKPCRACRPDQ